MASFCYALIISDIECLSYIYCYGIYDTEIYSELNEANGICSIMGGDTIRDGFFFFITTMLSILGPS